MNSPNTVGSRREQIAIVLRDVSFAYAGRSSVIDHCSTGIEFGRVVAVLGPNGAGKTTLLKLIVGALKPTTGAIEVSRRHGYVPQSLQLAFPFTVLDVVLMAFAREVSVFAVPTREHEQRAKQALELVGISAFARRIFAELSGGEQQLVVLARALAADAEVLVLDEPMASLDLAHQGMVLETLRRLNTQGRTIVFSTHNPQHADVIADDVALVVPGQPIVVETAVSALAPERLSNAFGVEIARIGGADRLSGVLLPAWAQNRVR